ncbi:MAG TPA: ferrochelatase [Puia sp.]|uniref:ferrochelatase n=1 Tax=Puia sp. TaxID=2045100 RepID=UPI002C95FCEA|nr:ferrochelatase [Puia sp.]HVU97534.1 ferrochelatase [Puia sp.]
MTSTGKRAIILMNLGSPDSTATPDVHRYLMEFLMDKRVIDYPWLFRKILVGGLIVPFRAKKSAEAYETIWTKEGSPLIVLTQQLQAALQPLVADPVEIAMRYGNPSMEDAYRRLLKKVPDLEEVIAVPLYPHYAMASYETAVEYAREIHRRNKYSFRLDFIKPFFDESHYLNALAEHIRPYLKQDYDHILFSYHGVPGRHIRKSDPTGNHCLQSASCCETASPAHATCYRHQCFTTTREMVRLLNIPEGRYSNSFQSRLGKGWLEPFTDIRLEEMPKEGIKKLLILCPAFVSDCLETLEEIAIRGKETFLGAGGEEYTMIPCLNIDSRWVDALAGWVRGYAEGDKTMVLG